MLDSAAAFLGDLWSGWSTQSLLIVRQNLVQLFYLFVVPHHPDSSGAEPFCSDFGHPSTVINLIY